MTKKIEQAVKDHDDEAVSAVEVQFTRDVLAAVHKRRAASPPKQSDRESAQEFEVRKSWWLRAQTVLSKSQDVADGELLERFAKGIIAYCNYNEANNLLRAITASMTYQYRRVYMGVIDRETKQLEKAKQLAGDSAVAAAVDALFADLDDGREEYPNQDEYFANLTEPTVRYIVEQFHALFTRIVARMYERDSAASTANNTPRPFGFEALPFTSINVDGVFVPMYSLDDAMAGIDRSEAERAGNAVRAISEQAEITL